MIMGQAEDSPSNPLNQTKFPLAQKQSFSYAGPLHQRASRILPYNLSQSLLARRLLQVYSPQECCWLQKIPLFATCHAKESDRK